LGPHINTLLAAKDNGRYNTRADSDGETSGASLLNHVNDAPTCQTLQLSAANGRRTHHQSIVDGGK
jgi:hypothetical protein